MARVVIDPVTRIEGHLRIEAEVNGREVTDAWSSGTMFRGIELILRGRDPREGVDMGAENLWRLYDSACAGFSAGG